MNDKLSFPIRVLKLDYKYIFLNHWQQPKLPPIGYTTVGFFELYISDRNQDWGTHILT